jgi:hypothetical protein
LGNCDFLSAGNLINTLWSHGPGRCLSMV